LDAQDYEEKTAMSLEAVKLGHHSSFGEITLRKGIGKQEEDNEREKEMNHWVETAAGRY
jgi:hypothetical protein